MIQQQAIVKTLSGALSNIMVTKTETGRQALDRMLGGNRLPEDKKIGELQTTVVKTMLDANKAQIALANLEGKAVLDTVNKMDQNNMRFLQGLNDIFGKGQLNLQPAKPMEWNNINGLNGGVNVAIPDGLNNMVGRLDKTIRNVSIPQKIDLEGKHEHSITISGGGAIAQAIINEVSSAITSIVESQVDRSINPIDGSTVPKAPAKPIGGGLPYPLFK